MSTEAKNPRLKPRRPAWYAATRRCFWAAAVLALALAGTPAHAKYASLVMDAKTGQVYHAVNADTRNYPASLTKMMTLYLVFEALREETWQLDTRLRVSARAARQPASKLGLQRGERITVEDAILALVTKSANDVATVVAENMSGNERAFALKMTAKARRLGMHRTTFRNASGLPHRGQLSTARDMATLARALLRDFPVYYRYFSTSRFVYDGSVHRNHNKLLETYDGTDGVKTGYINASGFNLVASAKRGGNRVIGVIFGGNSPRSRNALMTRLLNLGFKGVGNSGTVMAEANEKSAPAPTRMPPKAPVLAAAGADGDDEDDPIRFTKDRLWGIQVGAFARLDQAQEVAEKAFNVAASQLKDGVITVVPLKKRNGRVLHRARIHGITKVQAYRACRTLRRQKAQCMELRLPDTLQVAANDR